MDILVNIEHDIFDNDLEKMGFIAACIEAQTYHLGEEVKIQVIGIVHDPGTEQTSVISFRPGEGVETDILPSYLTYLGKMQS